MSTSRATISEDSLHRLDKLPFAPRPAKGEFCLSWLRRLAVANALDPVRLVESCLGKRIVRDFCVLARGFPDELTRDLAALCDMPASQISDTFVPWPWMLALDPPALFCRRCWNEDLYRNIGVYIRVAWCHPLTFYCTKHAEPLLDIPEELPLGDIERFLAEVAKDFWDYDTATPRHISSFFQSIEHRCTALRTSKAGTPHAFCIIDDLTTAIYRNFSASAGPSAECEIRFRLQHTEFWRRYWHAIFENFERNVFVYRTAPREPRYYCSLYQASERRFYLYVSLLLLWRWEDNEDHMLRRCFSADAWGWLRAQSDLWREDDLRALYPLVERVAQLHSGDGALNL